MYKRDDRITVIIQKGKRRIVTKAPLSQLDRLVFVINRQFTNAPNTTQIASGAGHSGAAGSNAAIKSPYTRQQQSVGAEGTAVNKDGRKNGRHRGPLYPQSHLRTERRGKEVVVVINEQIVKLAKRLQNASATQIASGAGTYSAGGTNAAIESRGTRQQHAVGADGKAINKWGSKRKSGKHRRG
ncbi:hypothetical protein [Cohnella sp. GCM10012308]|uniref:hypothetical protein n=1 Tax=Cohnella sp. GCM10012308 TaxID=3317329 RepID=UPI003611FB4E